MNEHGEPWGIASGPDGNVWFTDLGAPRAIGRITPVGAITEFEGGLDATSIPTGIAPGADGNLWFADVGRGAIGVVSTAGAIDEFSAGMNPGSAPVAIASGSDGNLWFADQPLSGTPAMGRLATAPRRARCRCRL